jgi:hypothetical protein
MHKTKYLLQILSLMTILLILPSGQASAAMRGCRADPIFTLSNGDYLAVILEIGTPADNVKNIHYILHLPPGVTVTRVIYTGGPRQALKETYVVDQGGPANTYTVDTFLSTHNSVSVRFTVFARLNGGLRTSVSGFNSQHLSTIISWP